MAKPKSPSLQCPSFNKIFYDLMSLWTMPTSLSLDRAQTICLPNICTNGSGSPCCEVLINLQRSPPQQNSVIMKQKLAVSKMSLILIVNLELQASWQRISFQSRTFYSAVLQTALSIALTHTNSKVQVSKPTQTSPAMPLPSFCSMENQYFPSFLRGGVEELGEEGWSALICLGCSCCFLSRLRLLESGAQDV